MKQHLFDSFMIMTQKSCFLSCVTFKVKVRYVCMHNMRINSYVKVSMTPRVRNSVNSDNEPVLCCCTGLH